MSTSIGMNNPDQSKLPINASPNEDREEWGLRILARVIARRLIKRRGGSEDKTDNMHADGLQASENQV